MACGGGGCAALLRRGGAAASVRGSLRGRQSCGGGQPPPVGGGRGLGAASAAAPRPPGGRRVEGEGVPRRHSHLWWPQWCCGEARRGEGRRRRQVCAITACLWREWPRAVLPPPLRDVVCGVRRALDVRGECYECRHAVTYVCGYFLGWVL
ncbi:hypothetical protein EMIHUDRAFT_441039 [Emiliania huxleyi CCMP1516]|uniref:Uncharacterized protein n=2 Tax=Emiliania huxleyi TaxID=2903 RepID=A0A0D3KH57_EMIH1|nr:hypothetical protein EMIHUDRAFT_441039 [Emiliania huxleyi CCMP1516]EOD35092.1 hypothetical protein EMIHUDRAFT_441039 [Emiliania huxleyi CCMP1516]|eukprot:XP_005787521.1 hypothetical protein EMIHUDRAFT_441039 [Emiliania huxleyi CCMP1516]